MYKLIQTSLVTAICFVIFSTPASADFVIDSFFDITYDISFSPDGGVPNVTATLPDGSDVPLRSKGTVKFFNASKGFSYRITVEQDIGEQDTLLISAKCTDDICIITEVENKGRKHRGHVTVLK